jgi:hypothetical protein
MGAASAEGPVVQMIEEWLDLCMSLAIKPQDFYTGGSRKIFRGASLRIPSLTHELELADVGFTKSKLSILTKHYLHEESRDVALELWKKRLDQRKYGSVGFTCYAHFVKGGQVDAKRSKIASVFGPCIQSVNITLLENKTVELDVFYRTTELFKKFPADLILLRDVLLPPFNLGPVPIKFYFANLTLHPMYFITVVPLLADPMAELERIRKIDPKFFYYVVKMCARYLVPQYGRGIENHSQSMRVKKDANERIDKATKLQLIDYLTEHHPGYRNVYHAPQPPSYPVRKFQRA